MSEYLYTLLSHTGSDRSIAYACNTCPQHPVHANYKLEGEWPRTFAALMTSSTSEAELQELVDHIDRVSSKCSILINIDKTKVMASDGIACHILVQNEQLEQVDTFPYLGSLITEDGECTMEF